MNRIFSFIAIALIALSSCSRYRYETVSGDPQDTKIYTLDNGLKIYMSVNKEAPRIQTYIAVKVGGKNDPAQTTGLAHYFEHLMFKGTENFGTSDYEVEKPMLDQIEQLFETYRMTSDEAQRAAIYHQIDSISYEASKIAIPNEYDKLMAMIGADGTNAWTSEDETVYTEEIPSNQIDSWARIQADRFMHPVLRGFHTELETIYEEKNMSLTQDSRKVWESLAQALFPNHPYGQQTVLGTQEHLKNPSITNVKKYHDTYYVPNNIAICVSGDFKPDEMVAAIKKYFGEWKPNKNIPALQFEPEQPISKPVVKEVFGPEAESMAMGWRLPGASDLKNSSIAQIASYILYNGQAGLVDLDVNQQQKTLGMYCGDMIQPDYGQFIVMGNPKQGQSLDQVKKIALEEIAKLRSGDFDEELIEATINNIKLAKQKELEDNSSRALNYVNAFINGVQWKEAAKEMERMESVTKEDVVAWANEFLGENNYAIVYKKTGEDKDVVKVSAPAITPIVTNRDMQSDFLTQIQNSSVRPIQPVFANYAKDVKTFDLLPGVEAIYKQNQTNDIFELDLIFNVGTEQDPSLSLAFDYLDYLDTPTMSAEERSVALYTLACNFYASVGANQTHLVLTGLSENMNESIEILRDLLANAQGDKDILKDLKADLLKERADAKLSQSSCFSALRRYITYGEDFVKRSTLSNNQVRELSSEELIAKAAGFLDLQFQAAYYGPVSSTEFQKDFMDIWTLEAELEACPEVCPSMLLTENSSVVLAPYKANQIYYTQYSNRGETFSIEDTPAITLYNEYFGGGMNTVVFQEMREARSLAYSAWAMLREPSFAQKDNYFYMAFIATQNDKMKTAIEAFDEIINDMPQSDAAFQIAKEALISKLRTERATGMNLIRGFIADRRRGLDHPIDKDIFEAVQDMSFEQVHQAQLKWVKDRKYTYAILGDIKDLDTDFLKTLGPVKTVKLEEIFGY
ncbi:MAG: insulinase family protein [Bacteroidales bacterium]|nr:insulinase family protein [Bacteroidales bacterium]